MASENASPVQPPSRPIKNRRQPKGPVFCVGWRAFVNWPANLEGPVLAMDRGGSPLTNDLADGQEVEILSWQPRSRAGLLYEIKRIGDGTEWWIGAAHLRSSGNGPAPVASPA